ncbi:MAG: S-layer homology domain-containing protein [Anaerovorax sp.]
MKHNKRIGILVIALTLAISSMTGVAFAASNEIDYSQWNTNSAYPTDIDNTPYAAAVKTLINKKILTGYPDGTFKPANPITRAEIAVAITKMTNRTSQVAENATKNIFTDLTNYDWAKGQINTLAQAGLVKGMTETTFAPAKNISYAELITILIRTNSGAASELDAMNNWPNSYIKHAQMYNMLGDVVVKDWNAPATRGDTAKLIYRFMPKN